MRQMHEVRAHLALDVPKVRAYDPRWLLHNRAAGAERAGDAPTVGANTRESISTWNTAM